MDDDSPRTAGMGAKKCSEISIVSCSEIQEMQCKENADKIHSKMGEGTFGQVLECWKNNYRSFPIDLILMHDLRLIHTDLKPENVLLVSSEYVKVPDYRGYKFCCYLFYLGEIRTIQLEYTDELVIWKFSEMLLRSSQVLSI